MKIYLISNEYSGAIAAYTDRESAIHEAAKAIILDSYGEYTERNLQKIECDLRRESDCRYYDYWVEPIELHSKKATTEKPAKLQYL